MDTLLQDVRFGWRQLRRTPGFTIAALLALALGIGATTAIFTVLDRVVLRPLPCPDADRLTMIWDTNAAKGLSHERISPVTFHDYRSLKHIFADGAGWWYPQVNVTEAGRDPLRTNAVEASGNFFSVIGVQPLIGSGFPESTFYSSDLIAVISHRLWRERFNSDPSIVGKPITLRSIVYTIVGVMPPGFDYPNGTDVWQRLQWDFAQHSRGAHFVESLFRLQPGVGVEYANAELRALTTRVPLPRLQETGVDARLLLFAVGLAFLTAIAFGVVPAMLMARGDIHRPLKEAGRGGEASGARARARSALVVAEIGLAVMLLVGAALLGRSFQRLVQEDPGFRSERALTVNVDLPASYRDFKKIADFYDQLLTSLRAQPGVSDAGLANFLPLDAAWRLRFLIEGRPRPTPEDAPLAQHQSVDEEYFKVIGVPLVKGRFFEPHDTVDAPGVVIVNESLARREWPNEDPIGQRITTAVRYIGPMGAVLMAPTTKYEIVGVVRDVKNASLSQPPEPAIYFTYRQFSFRGFNLVVKGQGSAAAMASAVRAAVQRLDPNLPLSSARTLDRIVGDATDRPRALMLLMGVFAALALLLSALGIYGVLSYSVSQRRQELSVRMALGAEPRDVLWLVVRQGLWFAAIGVAAGTAGALAVGRALSSLLYGVSSGDAAAFAVAIGVAVLTALTACVVPARRAAAIDPLAGLRAD